MLLAGVITLMDELYYKLAVWLNDKGLLLCYSFSSVKLFPLIFISSRIENFISPMQLENCLSDELLNIKGKSKEVYTLFISIFYTFTVRGLNIVGFH